jgi:hypothetical protein
MILAVILLGLFLILPGCGKKAPPHLPKQDLSWIISH